MVGVLLNTVEGYIRWKVNDEYTLPFFDERFKSGDYKPIVTLQGQKGDKVWLLTQE